MSYPNQLPCSQLRVGRNPRRHFDPEEMAELEASVKEQGVIQPILVRPVGDGFEIVAGGRRFAAAQKVHGDAYNMPVLVRDLSDAEVEELALIENVQRANMSPAEEAEAAAKVLARQNGDRDEAAKRLGWSRAQLDKRLALMNAVESVRDALVERKIKLGHAELIATLPKSRQDTVLEALFKAAVMPTVAELKAQVQAIANNMASAIFDKTACASCEHNSSNQQALFGDAISDGHCTNRECWEEKTEAELVKRADAMKDEYPTVKIVRPGENHTIIKIVAEGTKGVGQDQAKACRSCQSFGAAISAVPGKTGEVYTDWCFDSDCNSKKVESYQTALLAEVEAEQKAKTEAASTVGAHAPATSGTAPTTSKRASASSTSVQDSTRIKEYRVKVWRKALARHLAADAALGRSVLVALAASNLGRHVGGSRFAEAVAKLTGSDSSVITLANALTTVLPASTEAIDNGMRLLAASAAEDIDESNLVTLLRTLKVDLAAHWALSDEYLALLTKSELEVMAEEVGIKAHAGDAYAKMMSGKKDEIIKKLLAVEGFEYQGKVPANIRFEKA